MYLLVVKLRSIVEDILLGNVEAVFTSEIARIVVALGVKDVPAAYVEASLQADGPHVQPGGPTVGDHVFGPGYGYQWWLPAGDFGDYSAIGVYNQYIYVDPNRDTVIVKLSANPAYGTTTREEDNKDLENLSALRAISQHCAP